MTPQKKAKKLVKKALKNIRVCSDGDWDFLHHDSAKKVAMLTASEVLKELEENFDTLHSIKREHWWKEVMHEISIMEL